MKSLTYVEIDVPAWSQSSPDSPQTELTFRFAIDTDYLPADIDCIPSIKSVSISPAIVGLGSDLGQRATVTVTFKDHRHIFAGESFDSGTFWGKWRARYGLTLRGHPFRLIRGTLGQELEDMETRAFVVESSDGPNSTGEYKIIAKDVLKFADGDRAQAPPLSNGFLLADITNVATSATLSPTGIGSEYAASGYVAIGGNEIALFTRASDTLTLTRAQFNTVAVAHSAGDRVQEVLDLSGLDAATIISFLLQNYADVPASYIPSAEWLAEISGHLNVNFTGTIAEPTAVSKLISELIEQASLALWWDDIEQKIRLQVLRAVVGASTIDMGNMMAGSLEITEQPDKRLSQVYVYFGKINPLVKEDQIDNYRSTELQQDELAEAEYGTAAIKKIYSRWIPQGGRSTAELIANKHLGRFRDPPRRFQFDLLRYAQDDPQLGAGYYLESWQLQDTSGNAASVPIQVFRLNPAADRFEVEAEEMLWTPYGGDIDPNTKAIIFDANEANVNLRTRHDLLYPTPQSGQTINAYVTAIIYSTSTASPAFDVGTWPGGVTVNVIVTGAIRGHGGLGGNGGSLMPGPFASPGGAGEQGGTALYTRQAINLTSTNGAIWGGGGGGGGGGGWAASSGGFGSEAAGSGGGGGAGHGNGSPGVGGTAAIGFQVQVNGVEGAFGSAETGGAGGNAAYAVNSSAPGGAGGGAGQAGTAGTTPSASGLTSAGGAGGAAGNAIDGDSFVTDIGGVGDIRGAQVN